MFQNLNNTMFVIHPRTWYVTKDSCQWKIHPLCHKSNYNPSQRTCLQKKPVWGSSNCGLEWLGRNLKNIAWLSALECRHMHLVQNRGKHSQWSCFYSGWRRGHRDNRRGILNQGFDGSLQEGKAYKTSPPEGGGANWKFQILNREQKGD